MVFQSQWRHTKVLVGYVIPSNWKFLAASVLTHSLLFWSLSEREQSTVPDIVVSVDIKFTGSKSVRIDLSPVGSYFKDPGPEPYRVSNTGNEHLDIGVRASADNYIERIRYYVEPNWRREVTERAKQLKLMRKSYKCTSCVEALISSKGTATNVFLTVRCQDDLMNGLAVKALDQQFTPPPSTLIKNDQMILDWCFWVH